MKSYTAVILARKGSVRIPGKNMRLLRGRPLVEWTIMAANYCPYIDHTIVSTDWDAVANLALDHECTVVHRSPELATSEADSYGPIHEVLSTIGMVENAVLLQPTSPTRNATALSYFISAADHFGEPIAAANPGASVPNGSMYAAPGALLMGGFKWEDPFLFRIWQGPYFTDVDTEDDFILAESEMLGQRGPLLSWE